MKSGLHRGAWEGWLDDGDNGGGESRSPRPPARTATNYLRGPPPRVAPLQPTSGTTGGKQLGLSSARAAERARTAERRGGSYSGCRAGTSGFLSGARAQQHRGPRVPPRLLPPGAAGSGVARPHRGRAYLGLCRGDPRPPRPAANSPAVAPATAAACSASRGGGAANHGRGGRGAYWEEKRELWEFWRQTFPGRK